MQLRFENNFECDEYLKKYEEEQFLILCIVDCSVFRLSAIGKLTYWQWAMKNLKSLCGKCLHSEFECVSFSALVRQSLKHREPLYPANLPVRFRLLSFGTPNIQSLCIQASRDFVFLSFGIPVYYGASSAAISCIINPSRMKRSMF